MIFKIIEAPKTKTLFIKFPILELQCTLPVLTCADGSELKNRPDTLSIQKSAVSVFTYKS